MSSARSGCRRKLHTRDEQQRWIGAALALGVMLGIALWYVLPSVLPWGAGDWLASSLIGGGRWQAGETLMERASPASFDRMVRLYNACGRTADRDVRGCVRGWHGCQAAGDSVAALSEDIRLGYGYADELHKNKAAAAQAGKEQ